MYFSTLKAILLRGLDLSLSISRNPSNDEEQRRVSEASLDKRQQPGPTTGGGQIIYSIPADGDTYGGVPSFNWTQVETSFIANSTAVIFSILVRNDPSFFSFDDLSCTAPGNDTNLIANAGFEAGVTDPWFLVGVTGLPYAGYLATHNASVPHSGNWDFYDGAVGGIDGISQVVDTVPGTKYSVSFVSPRLAKKSAAVSRFVVVFGVSEVASSLLTPKTFLCFLAV